jgi:cyclohexadieny/prephenate dehydrogenase
MQLNVLTIVGVGLIGGSIGLAARQRGVARIVRGVGRQQASLDRARNVGAVDETFVDLAPAVAGAEVVVFCTPVDHIARQVLEAAPSCAPGTILTDAGSTKGRIVREVTGQLGNGVAFVGSHPLAGSEKRGPDFADAELFTGRWTVITPTEATDPRALERVTAFWQALGSRTRVMSPEAHDEALAMTSHLPHLAAAALAGMLPDELRSLTATGFRDTTRIAAGDPQLWTAISAHNHDALAAALMRLEERLAGFRHAIEAGDWAALRDLLARAKEVRDALEGDDLREG